MKVVDFLCKIWYYCKQRSENMFNFEEIRELLPKDLQCKKVSKYDEIADYKLDVFFGYDENGRVYTISRDKKGNLHVVERNFAEEQAAHYEAIMNLGKDMTLLSDPSFLSSQHQEQENRDTKPKRKIILTPIKDRLKKGYSIITIEFGDTSYSIVNNHGNIEINHNGEYVEISPDEQKDCFDILRRPFRVSLLDKVKMRNIRYTGDDRLHHIEKTNQYKSVFVPITPECMKEWDEAEK